MHISAFAMGQLQHACTSLQLHLCQMSGFAIGHSLQCSVLLSNILAEACDASLHVHQTISKKSSMCCLAVCALPRLQAACGAQCGLV